MKSIDWTQFRRMAALGCVLLGAACSSEPGAPGQDEPSSSGKSSEPSAESAAEPSAPPPIVEEPGVALAPMGTSNGYEGSPVYSLNGTRLSGAHEHGVFKELIDTELTWTKRRLPERS